MRKILVAALAASFAVPAFADETEGHVMAFDRAANIIVLTDKTVWSVSEEIVLPDDLARGDRVLFEYSTAGEDGMIAIDAVTRLAPALPDGTDGGS